MKKWTMMGLFGMFVIGALACETELGNSDLDESDAGCSLYLDPAAAPNGDGSVPEKSFANVDDALAYLDQNAKTCKSPELLLPQGAFADPQFKALSSALKSRGVIVREIARNITPNRNANYDSNRNLPTVTNHLALQNPFSDASPFPHASDNVEDNIPRSGSTSTYYLINAAASPFLALDATAGSDWAVRNNGGTYSLSTYTGAVTAPTFTDYFTATTSAIALKKATTVTGVTTLNGNTTVTGTTTLTGNTTMTGYVGISSTAISPASKVHIHGATISSPMTNGVLRIQDNGSSLVLDGNQIESTSHLYVNFWNGNDITLAKGGGHVGIGIAADAGYRLTVDGAIKAEELVLDTVGTADFVFEDDYDLMSLNEVSKYVNENNHLPGIASAAEMKTNGLSIGEFQGKLLQKIEELTLHTIALNKRIAKLEKGKCAK